MSRLPCPFPGHLLDPMILTESPAAPALQVDSLPPSHPASPWHVNDDSHMKNLAQYYICIKIFSFKICRCLFSFLRAFRVGENSDVSLFISTLVFCLAACHPVVFGCSWLSLQRLFWVGHQEWGDFETASGLSLPCCPLSPMTFFMIGLFKTLYFDLHFCPLFLPSPSHAHHHTRDNYLMC